MKSRRSYPLLPGPVIGVHFTDISGWMIVVGEKCYGGYTIQVAMKNEPEAAPPFDFVELPN